MQDQSFGQSTASVQLAENETRSAQPTQQAESFDIRTMPDAFSQKTSTSAPLPWGLLLGGGVFVLALVGVGLYFLLTSNGGASSTVSAPSTNESPLAQPVVQPETPPVSDASPVVVPDGGEPKIPADSNTKPDASVFPKVLSRTTDTDNDNLTDEEEKTLFTDPARSDTDGDGYADGQELENLYDPLAPSPALIEKSRSVAPFENKQYGYRLLYPSAWPAPRPSDASATQMIIVSPIAEEFFTINVLDNPNQQSALEWYLGQAPANTDPRRLSRKFVEDLEGVWSIDGRTVFLTYGFGGSRRWIYGITYNAGEKDELSYLTIFHMLIDSFRATPVVIPSTGVTAPVSP